QWDFLIVGLLSLMTLFLRRRRFATSGALASIMIVKPQLFLIAVPGLLRIALRRGGRRFAIAFIAISAVAALASTIAFPTWWGYYLDVPAAKAGDLRAAALPNGLRDIFGPIGIFAGVALDLLLVAIALRFTSRGSSAVPVWMAVSLVMAPYIFVYDHIIAIVPVAIATAIVAERGRAHALLVAALGFGLLVGGATLVHAFPGVAFGSLAVNGLVLYALAVLVVAAMFPWRHDDRESPIPATRATPIM
ncbi:MAG TPA: hypothetical protein VI814_14160, partial [Candidatus Limnocylindria bacterium]